MKVKVKCMALELLPKSNDIQVILEGMHVKVATLYEQSKSPFIGEELEIEIQEPRGQQDEAPE